MKVFTLFICLFVINFIYANEDDTNPGYANEIDRINNDMCWVGQYENGLVKVANFNSKLNFMFYRESILPFIKVVEDKVYTLLNKDIRIRAREVYLHCSAPKTHLIINSFHDGFGICAVGLFKPHGLEFDVLAITDNKTGECSGVEPGKLMGYLKDGNKNEILEVISNQEEVEKVEQHPGKSSLFNVILKQDYYFEYKSIASRLTKFSDVKYVFPASQGLSIRGEVVELEYFKEK